MGESECMSKLVNGDEIYHLSGVGCTVWTPVFEAKVQHHTIFFAIELGTDAFGMGVFVGHSNPYTFGVSLTPIPASKFKGNGFRPGALHCLLTMLRWGAK